jgi:hypothetical protein
VSDDLEDLDGLSELLGEDGRRQPDPITHPASGVLSAYAAKKLPSDKELEVQEHLVACQRCRNLILDFASFMETPLDEPREEVATPPIAAELQEQLSPPITVMSRRIKKEPLWQIILPIAACVALVVLTWALMGASRSNKRLRAQIADLQAPRVGMTSVRLEAVRGAALPISSSKITDLEIFTSSSTRFPLYDIELAEEDGRVFWSRSVEKEDGNLHLFLMPGFPKPGLYRIRLFGVQGAERALLESYSVRIKP